MFFIKDTKIWVLLRSLLKMSKVSIQHSTRFTKKCQYDNLLPIVYAKKNKKAKNFGEA